jgi:GT2 family glycosyltransferase
MDLSVIIVSWQSREKLRANLKALFNSQGDFTYEVFVVDNNSNDGTVAMVQTEFSQVHLISNLENLGFAKANNQAILKTKGDYILLFNPDMLVGGDTLFKALSWAKNNQQAVVSGFKLTDQNQNIIKQVRKFPTLLDQLAVVLKIPHFLPSVLDKYLVKNFDYEKTAKVDSIRGAFFLINKKRWQEISGENFPLLDERYFIWFEEVDFCKQVYQRGGEVWYSPEATCVDYVGFSFNQVSIKTKQIYIRDSMLKYFRKWHKTWEYNLLKVAWCLVTSVIKIFVK